MDYYKILWKKSAVKELEKIDKQFIPRIISTIESLSNNPLPVGVKKLSGADVIYRIRIGDFRVIYSLYEKELIVEIVKVGHRKDVYKK